MTDRELIQRVFDELIALRSSNLDMHKSMGSAKESIHEVKLGMARLEERVGGMLNERLRKHSDRMNELSVAISAVQAEAAKHDEEVDEKLDTLIEESAEKRGSSKVWTEAKSYVGGVVAAVATALLIKACGG